jgi:hypothetical protein
MAGDVPEALIPDEEHVVLHKDTNSGDHNLAMTIASGATEGLIVDTAGVDLGNASADATAKAWYTDTFAGTSFKSEWDGVMHLEIKDSAGVWHRRQSREWWVVGEKVYVSFDRDWRSSTDTKVQFRIYQPEFFVSDDVMQVLEPARIYDDSRQQIWKIDTAGAYRQDMVDFQGEHKGRPYRMWRGRHFQLQPPRKVPAVDVLNNDPDTMTAGGVSRSPWTTPTDWDGPEEEGKFRFCYTFTWGKRDPEWQKSSMPSHGGLGGQPNVIDPVWESAPSPVSDVIDHSESGNEGYAIRLRGVNIDAMTGFDANGEPHETHSGMKIRFYVARDGTRLQNRSGFYDNVEEAGIFYFLAEVDPASVSPTGNFTWVGKRTPDYSRPLKHSTGYFAWKVYPHQDARYELDLRVLRLPRRFVHDQDTAPIQRDSVSALLELALHYMCLIDGNDQTGAEMHLKRYQELARRYRHRYANPGGIVEPTPLGGHSRRFRYGTFSST